jgi:hypothetical protein
LKVSCIYPDLANVKKMFGLLCCQYLLEGSLKQMAALDASFMWPTVNSNCIKNGELEPGLWTNELPWEVLFFARAIKHRYIRDWEGWGTEKNF